MCGSQSGDSTTFWAYLTDSWNRINHWETVGGAQIDKCDIKTDIHTYIWISLAVVAAKDKRSWGCKQVGCNCFLNI